MKQRTKKILVCLLIVSLVAALAACDGDSEGGDRSVRDFRSIACTETGQILSLGDRKAAFDEAFGEAEDLGYGIYRYLDGSLEVEFQSGKAFGIQVNTHPYTDRVEFYGMSMEMTLQDLFDNFTPSDMATDQGGVFHKYFDSSGNQTPQEESEYTLTVAYFDPFGIIYVVLHQNS